MGVTSRRLNYGDAVSALLALVILGVTSGCVDRSKLIAARSTGSHSAEKPTSDKKSNCDEAGETWFKKNYPLLNEQAKGVTGKATYSVHYSAVREGCFLEAVEAVHIGKEADLPVSGDTETHRLIDLNTGEQVGQFLKMSTFDA